MVTSVDHRTSDRGDERSEYRRRRLLAVDDGSHGGDGDTKVASVTVVNDRPLFTLVGDKSFAAASPLYIMVMVRLKDD